jgi:hypothetical protein
MEMEKAESSRPAAQNREWADEKQPILAQNHLFPYVMSRFPGSAAKDMPSCRCNPSVFISKLTCLYGRIDGILRTGKPSVR